MKFTIPLLIASFLITVNSLLFAQSININTAKKIAQNHLLSVGKNNLKSANPNQSKFQFSSLSITSESKDTLYFVLNDTINHSFVIVAADKRSTPIIGYSLDGNYNENNQPPAFVAWMENRKKEIESIKENNLQADSKISLQWDKLSSSNYDNTETTTSVEPLLKTKWGQGCYYNEMCPADTRSSLCGHAPTGCVATAMAQIMKFWNYPTKGSGSSSYAYGDYGTISADFGSTNYEWNQMPNSLTGSNSAVATLMYHCGVAAGMGYGPYVSWTNLMPEVLIDFFDYSLSLKPVNRKDYNPNEWADLLKSELDLGHPVYYTTELASGSGHAFVCDGYEDSDFFHFNWGWDGTSDGFYYLKSLNPNSQIVDQPQKAIIKIIPSRLPDGYKGVILSTNALLINSKEGVSDPIPVNVASSSDWTATSNQSWLSLSSGFGVAGTSTLKLTTTENLTNLDRGATITLTADGFPPQLITIKQFRGYKVTAGGLDGLLGNDLRTVTNLTLKGVIDARDFKTMRDLMLSLESLDLTEATIVAYTGDQGPGIGSRIYPANTIPENAFLGSPRGENTRLTSIVLPVSATSIGNGAFNACMGLTNISLPTSLQSIGRNVFDNCTNLRSIFIPYSVQYIGRQIFRSISISVDAANPNFICHEGVLYNKAKTTLIYCPTTKKGIFNIPETVNTIGVGAFYSCMDITSIVIPSSMRFLETWAFVGCSGLTSISIPSSVNVIQDGLFFACTGLTSITVGNPFPVDLKFYADVFSEVNKDKCTLKVPYKTAALYRTANQWKDFKNIVEAPNGFSLGATEVKLTSANNSSAEVSVKSNVSWSTTSDQTWLSVSPASGIGDNTIILTAQEKISEGTRIGKVTVSSDGFENQIITVLQDGAAIKVTPGNLAAMFTNEELRTITSLKLAGNIDARDFKTMRDLMLMLESIDLSGTNILAYSGTEGTSLGDITSYPANEIPESAFWIDGSDRRMSPKSFILPVSTTSIGDYAFLGSVGLTIFSFTPSLRSIGEEAFSFCKNLANIYITSWVTRIEDNAFAGSFAQIEVDTTNPYYSSLDGVLYNKTKTTLVHCPTSESGSFIIPPTVTTIGQKAFSYCSNITSVSIPSSVNKIQYFAFGQCKSLTSITVGSPVPVVLDPSDYVFHNVSKITCILYVPFGSKAAYQAANLWGDFTNIVEGSNQAPVANAGPDQTVNEKILVSLTGAGSTDADGNQLTFQWTAPAGITLSSNTASKPTFTAPEVSIDTKYTFSMVVNDGFLNSTADPVIITVKNVDKAPYLKNPISNISVDKRAPDQVIDLKTIFADDDLGDVLSYSVTSNTNNQVVTTKITGSSLTLSFSTLNTGLSEIEVTANSNGKVVITKFNVEVKIPTGIDPLVRNQKLTVFPNPTNGKIKIVFDQIPKSGTELTVTDITGKTILIQIIQENEEWIDLKGNTPGVYLLKTNFNNTKAQKVILR